MDMNQEELVNTVGGATSYTSATFINALARGMNVLYGLGRALGTALRMTFSKRKC